MGETLNAILQEIGRRTALSSPPMRVPTAMPSAPFSPAAKFSAAWASRRKSSQRRRAAHLPPLPFVDSVINAQSINGHYEAAIVLECDSIQRANLPGLEKQFLINIDHHVSGQPFAHVNWIDPSACATAELIYRLARAANVPICPNVATCLYTAVLTDTGAFCYVGTSERTFALAQELVRAGADPPASRRVFIFPCPHRRFACSAPRFPACIATATWRGWPSTANRWSAAARLTKIVKGW